MGTYYITTGDIRGRCPHRHRTIQGALACLRRDRDGCHSQGGYSDRCLVEVSPTGRREIEVYTGAAHGWCPPDSGVYNEPLAERAWSRLLALYGKALA